MGFVGVLAVEVDVLLQEEEEADADEEVDCVLLVVVAESFDDFKAS